MNIPRITRIRIAKYCAPILYLLVVFISLTSISWLMGISQNMYYECNTIGEVWSCRGLPVAPLLAFALRISSFLLPGVILLIGNGVIGLLEGLHKPKIIDHIRYTFLLYIPIIITIYATVQFSLKNDGASWDAPGLYLINFYVLFAIGVNAGYMILKRVWSMVVSERLSLKQVKPKRGYGDH